MKDIKAKAIEIIDKYRNERYIGTHLFIEEAKKCALIAQQEKIDLLNRIIISGTVQFYENEECKDYHSFDDELKRLIKIKDEINQL